MAVKRPKFFINKPKEEKNTDRQQRKYFFTEEGKSASRGKSIIIGIGLLLVLTGAGIGAWYFFTNQKQFTVQIPKISVSLPFFQSQPSPTPTRSKEVTPTATPTPRVIDPQTYTVQILNGSGIPGNAGKAKKLLEEKKYIVKSTGNANSFNYQTTEIQAKKHVEKIYLDQLATILSASYKLASQTAELKTGETDIVIIIGKQTP